MTLNLPALLAVGLVDAIWISALAVVGVIALIVIVALVRCGGYWLPAYLSRADVSFLALVGMSFRQIPLHVIVNAKIMGRQAGMNIDRRTGMSTARLEARFFSRAATYRAS